jgi:hypothetical protein
MYDIFWKMTWMLTEFWEITRSPTLIMGSKYFSF